MLQCADIHHLLNSIYASLTPTESSLPPPEYFLHRMILSPRNEDVDEINQAVLDRMPGEEHVLYSIDRVI
ncbi:hypothetical protein C8Q70DRAFT_890345, partial [Cubamyces menziesii]